MVVHTTGQGSLSLDDGAVVAERKLVGHLETGGLFLVVQLVVEGGAVAVPLGTGLVASHLEPLFGVVAGVKVSDHGDSPARAVVDDGGAASGQKDGGEGDEEDAHLGGGLLGRSVTWKEPVDTVLFPVIAGSIYTG